MGRDASAAGQPDGRAIGECTGSCRGALAAQPLGWGERDGGLLTQLLNERTQLRCSRRDLVS
jgi:hypothetical protein